MATVQVNGLGVAYDRVGEGPPVVFLHGAAEDARVWRPQLDALADEFTVVAWDEPGAGRSSGIPESFSLADYAYCLAGVVESLGLGPAHIAGLSWGGTLALEFYRHHADLVTTLILVDTYAGWKGSLPAEEVRAAAQVSFRATARAAARSRSRTVIPGREARCSAVPGRARSASTNAHAGAYRNQPDSAWARWIRREARMLPWPAAAIAVSSRNDVHSVTHRLVTWARRRCSSLSRSCSSAAVGA
ncbi:alpha/beta fold hydrolase [Streptomyces sp. NPDC006602]|uniref:alpha/beta fold hydrolase n=1 Tax=Streptomyces sp. NPDC006602 TaxID=3364751 RepID=UPI0036A54951